jgi:hypothetical protein
MLDEDHVENANMPPHTCVDAGADCSLAHITALDLPPLCSSPFVRLCAPIRERARGEFPLTKAAVATLIASFTSNTKTNYESHLPLLFQILLKLFVEEGDLLQAGWDALDLMMKTVNEGAAAKHITFVRSVISDIAYDSDEHVKRVTVPGFCLKKVTAQCTHIPRELRLRDRR